MRTVSNIISLFYLFALLGCNSQTKSNKYVSKVEVNKINCMPYFDFDKIDHHFVNIDEANLWKIEEKKKKTKEEIKLLELLLQDTPNKISDTGILKDIHYLGFIKKEISLNKFREINEFFCQRKHEESYYYACIAIYRDILVFKKQNKIIGTAKICFSCNQSIITGTTLDTDEFGQSGDYKKLYKLLH